MPIPADATRALLRIPVANRLLLAGIAMLLAPRLADLPAWLIPFTAFLLLWRVAHDAGRVRLPARGLLILLVLAGVAGLFLNYRTLAGRDIGAALLLFLVVAKLLEMHHRRDVFVVLFLSDFLLVVGFLFQQSLAYSLWMLATLAILLAAQIHFTRNPAGQMAGAAPDLRLSARLLVQSLPLALVLFLVFPRPGGPLWGMPDDALSARTGLGERVSPGRISRLADDDSVAFRVRFTDPAPTPRALYWRGLVHVLFDGRTWYADARPQRGFPPTDLAVQALSRPLRYTVTLQPHQRRWLFFLDAPVSAPADSLVTPNRQILAAHPLHDLRRYDGVSALRYRIDADRPPGPVYLKVPEGLAPKSRQWIRQLQAQGLAGRRLVDAILEHFRAEAFYYSRRPPLLPVDPVDTFLFETRTGFCEHYASAFAVLARLAGIPARLVSGYQGGEVNPLDDYLIVRQSDAHAWVEIWLAGEGWVRIDPTAVIPPERILETPERLRPRHGDAAARILPQGWLQRSLRQALFAWDMVNNRWNQWVLGFDRLRQRDLFARFGLDPRDGKSVALLLGGAAAVMLGLLALALAWQNRSHSRRSGSAGAGRFCRRLARRRLVPGAGETPAAFARRCAAALPGQAGDIEAILALYLRLRYGPHSDPAACRDLRQRIRRFRPG